MRPLRWVGTRSYGLYLYHWPIYQIVRRTGHQLSVGQFFIALAIAVPITEISYRFVERPIREGRYRANAERRTRTVVRRRRRTLVALVAAVGVTGFAAVNIAAADVLCVGQIECDSQRGQQAIAGDHSPVTMPSVATSSTSIVSS